MELQFGRTTVDEVCDENRCRLGVEEASDAPL